MRESTGRISVLCPTCRTWSEWPSTVTAFIAPCGHSFTLREAEECWPGGIAEERPPRLTSAFSHPVTCGVCGVVVQAANAEWIDREEAGLPGYWLCDRCEARDA